MWMSLPEMLWNLCLLMSVLVALPRSLTRREREGKARREVGDHDRRSGERREGGKEGDRERGKEKESGQTVGLPGGRVGRRVGGRAGTCHAGCGWSRTDSDIKLFTRCSPLHCDAHAKACAAARASGSSFFAIREHEGNARWKHEVHDGLLRDHCEDVGQRL
jgi:hypothetical protein